MPKTYSDKQLHSMHKEELIDVIETYQQQNLKRRESIKQTIAVKQQKGEPLGRPKSKKPENYSTIVEQLSSGYMDIDQAAKLCGVSSRTFRRWLKEGDANEN